MPARGERAAGRRGCIRHLGALESRLADLAGRDVLLVGHGHSAADALDLLAALEPAPRVTWATRSPNRRPCVEVADDPLPERQPRDRARQRPGRGPARLPAGGAPRGRRGAPTRRTAARRGALGRPAAGASTRWWASPATGPTCRSFPSWPSRSRRRAKAPRAWPAPSPGHRLPVRARGARGRPGSGEPGFHLVGAKSYGRLPTFLLQTGLAQLETVLDRLAAAARVSAEPPPPSRASPLVRPRHAVVPGGGHAVQPRSARTASSPSSPTNHTHEMMSLADVQRFLAEAEPWA